MKGTALVLLAVLVAGCSSQPETPPPSAELLMLDENYRWQSHDIPDVQEQKLRRIVQSEPDEEFDDNLPLEPIYSVEVDGTKYALEPDEIIFLGMPRTRRWKAPGIRKEILEAVAPE